MRRLTFSSTSPKMNEEVLLKLETKSLEVLAEALKYLGGRVRGIAGF